MTESVLGAARMKVRDRIVADGIDDPSFDASNVGDYLKAADIECDAGRS